MTLIKRVGKALAVIVVVLAVSGFASHQYVNHVEKQRPIVTLAKHPKKCCSSIAMIARIAKLFFTESIGTTSLAITLFLLT